MHTHLVMSDGETLQAVIKRRSSYKDFTRHLIWAIEDATGEKVELLPEINPNDVDPRGQEFTAKMEDYNYIFTLTPICEY